MNKDEELLDIDLFSDIFGEETEESSLLEDSFDDLFGNSEFGEELEESFDSEESFSDLFGDKEFEENSSASNYKEWLETEDNPQLINIKYENPNDAIYFRDPIFDYSKDYSDLKFIFERFRSDLLEGEL